MWAEPLTEVVTWLRQDAAVQAAVGLGPPVPVYADRIPASVLAAQSPRGPQPMAALEIVDLRGGETARGDDEATIVIRGYGPTSLVADQTRRAIVEALTRIPRVVGSLTLLSPARRLSGTVGLSDPDTAWTIWQTPMALHFRLTGG